MPTPPEKPLFFESLVGGIDQNSALTLIKRDMAKRCKNFSLEESNLRTVEGFQQFTTTSASGTPLQGGNRIYLADQDPFTLIAYDGTVYRVDDFGGIGPALVTGLSTSNPIYFPYDREVVMVFDGEHTPKISTDGTVWFTAGIAPPTVAPTLSETGPGGALILVNAYQVAYAYATSSAFDINLVQEGNGSPSASLTLTGTNRTIVASGPRSTDPKVNLVNIYARNITIGGAVLRFVGQVANPPSGNWTFNIVTEPNTAERAIPVLNHAPGPFRYGWFHNGRWWAFDSVVLNREWFSEIFSPQSWPPTYNIDYPTQRGDDLTAAEPQGDITVVFGQTGFFIRSGASVLDIEIRPSLSVGTGAFNPKATAKLDTGVLHVGPAGIYIFDGALDSYVGKFLETGWRDMMRHISEVDQKKIACVYYPRLKQAMVALPRMYIDNVPGEYVLDTIRTLENRGRAAWFSTNRDVLGYIHWNGNEPDAGDYDKLLSWPNTGRVLNRERIDSNLNGAPMQAIYEGPSFHTQFRESIAVMGYVEYEPTDGDLTIQITKGGQVFNSQTFNMGGGLSLYGIATYGSGSYGGAARARKVLTWPLVVEGGEFSINLRYNGNGRARIFSYGFSLVPESQLRTM